MTAVGVLALANIVAFGPLYLSGCGVKAPPQLSPVGDTAYYARRVMGLVEELQLAATEGEAAGAVSKADARKIVEATVIAGKAGQDLASALRAGADATSSRGRAIAIIKQALDDLPRHLSDSTQALVRPYINAVMVLLTVFEPVRDVHFMDKDSTLDRVAIPNCRYCHEQLPPPRQAGAATLVQGGE